MTSELKASVLIVGSMAFDDLQLPSTSEVGVIGGAATYASLATSLFTPARIVAVVGTDFPEATLAELRRRGVDTTGVARADGQTFRWSGRYSADFSSRTTLDTQLNVFADFQPLLPPSYRATPYVLLANIHPALQLQVLDQIEDPRFVASDTMNYWIAGERQTLQRVLSRTDTLVINDEELRQLAEQHNLKRAAMAVRKLGPRRLVVKRGECGAMLFDDAGVCFIPAFPLDEEIDPTGAGDTFAGALLGHLAECNELSGASLRRALLSATTVASFCVEDVGTRRLARLTRDEVNQRLEALRSLMRVE
jgi:sugar/nucleoside kinase (ribokinase family)